MDREGLESHPMLPAEQWTLAQQTLLKETLRLPRGLGTNDLRVHCPFLLSTGSGARAFAHTRRPLQGLRMYHPSRASKQHSWQGLIVTGEDTKARRVQRCSWSS